MRPERPGGKESWMQGYNRVILVGNMVRQPQVKELESGTKVARLRLAVNRRRNGPDGKVIEEADFVNVSGFGALADVLERFGRKGEPILVDGRLRQRVWTDAEGRKSSSLEVIMDSFKFLGGRPPESKGELEQA